MGTWNSRGLRGSTLEEMVNWTNDHYLEKGLALLQKIPTPITPVRMDADHKQITLAYFEKRSTVDYIGAVQGIPVCFDAKECVADTFPLHNIHEHQITFMTQFEHQDGIAFILIYYSERNELYYMRFEEMIRFWSHLSGGISQRADSLRLGKGLLDRQPCAFLQQHQEQRLRLCHHVARPVRQDSAVAGVAAAHPASGA